MLTLASQLARRHLGPNLRKRFKLVVDTALSPIGSVAGARQASNAVVLTFDDGPDADVTPRLLALLRERKARATFFLLSEKASSRSDIVRMIIDHGHEVGLHFDRHDRITTLATSTFRHRLRDARKQLEHLVGPIRWFRPPFGAQSLATFLISRSQGLDIAVWGPYAADWEEQTADAAAARVLDTVRGGDVVLLHDGLELPEGQIPPTFDRVRMVELILDGLEQRDLRAETLGAVVAASGSRRAAWFRS